MSVKQVIVMRDDLNMRKGKMIAQGAHASMKSLIDGGQKSSKPERYETHNGMSTTHRRHFIEIELNGPTKEWLDGSFAKICVRVSSEDALLAIDSKARRAGIQVALIQDAGKTEFHNVPTYTCLALGPDDSDKIDKITGELKLL